jgi:hypothetical protein
MTRRELHEILHPAASILLWDRSACKCDVCPVWKRKLRASPAVYSCYDQHLGTIRNGSTFLAGFGADTFETSFWKLNQNRNNLNDHCLNSERTIVRLWDPFALYKRGPYKCYTAVTNLARRGRRLVCRQYLLRESLLTKRRS